MQNRPEIQREIKVILGCIGPDEISFEGALSNKKGTGSTSFEKRIKSNAEIS